MKKVTKKVSIALLAITCLCFSINTNAQIVNIPDAIFKNALVSDYTINTSMNTEIEVEEVQAPVDIASIEVEKKGKTEETPEA